MDQSALFGMKISYALIIEAEVPLCVSDDLLWEMVYAEDDRKR